MGFVKTCRVKCYTPFSVQITFNKLQLRSLQIYQFVRMFWTYFKLKFLYAINYKNKPDDVIFEVHRSVKTMISIS
jgi:hypothetical protein